MSSITRLGELLAEAKRHRDLEVRSAVLADLAIEVEALLRHASNTITSGDLLRCKQCRSIVSFNPVSLTGFETLLASVIAHQCHVDQ